MLGTSKNRNTLGNRAVLIINLGYVCRNGSVDQHAHWSLVVDTRVITKFRTVKTYGQYPWVAKVDKGLAPVVPPSDICANAIPSGGVSDSCD